MQDVAVQTTYEEPTQPATEAERAAGGHAIVARSLDDVLDALRAAGAPIETHTGR